MQSINNGKSSSESFSFARARSFATCCNLGEGTKKFLFYGGENYGALLADFFILDISKGDGKWAWKEPTIDLNGGEHPGYRKNAAMGCIGKHVYIFGGTAWNAEGDEVALNDVFVFEWNNKTNTLTLLPEIQVGGVTPEPARAPRD